MRRALIMIGIVLLAVGVGFLVLRSVKAGEDSGPLGAVRVAEEQQRLGIAPAGGPRLAEGPRVEGDFPTLNADQYRQEIVDIDRLIFARDAFTEARRASLASRLQQLAERVKGASSARFLEIESAELKQLAGYAASTPQSFLENHWMRIRNNLFDDRSWFARSAEDLESTPTATDPASAAVPSGPFMDDTSEAATPQLEGAWWVRQIFGNGRQMTDAEMSNANLIFRGDRLSIQSPNGKTSRYQFTTVADSDGLALRLQSDGTNDGPAEIGWMNYQFSGSALKLAFYDGLGERPSGFVASEGKADPMLVVIVLERKR